MTREPFGPNRSGGRDDNTGDPALEELAKRVIGCVIAVHRALGPGYPESVYVRALALELTHQGIRYAVEAPVRVLYRGQEVGSGRVDLLVEGTLIVEAKAVESLTPRDPAQTLAYLNALNLKLGLLINFNVPVVKDGIRRVIRRT